MRGGSMVHLLWLMLLGAAGGGFGSLLSEPAWGVRQTGGASVCMALDRSASMVGVEGFLGGYGASKMAEMARAARDFAERASTAGNRMAVVSFASDASVDAPLGSSFGGIQSAISRVGDLAITRPGDTYLHDGLDAARRVMRGAPGRRFVLLFTDGMPVVDGMTGDEGLALGLAAARQLRASGVRLVAVGTGDALTDYLAELTGDPGLVFRADPGSFSRAFEQAQQAITGLMDSSTAGRALLPATSCAVGIRCGLAALGALLAMGIGLALLGGRGVGALGIALAALAVFTVGTAAAAMADMRDVGAGAATLTWACLAGLAGGALAILSGQGRAARAAALTGLGCLIFGALAGRGGGGSGRAFSAALHWGGAGAGLAVALPLARRLRLSIRGRQIWLDEGVRLSLEECPLASSSPDGSVGIVVRSTVEQSTLGLMNCSLAPWEVLGEPGTSALTPPGAVVPLVEGLVVRIAGQEARVIG